MAFDGNPHDYTKVASPPKVYDRDNPPKTMSEAIRMAVADVELMLSKGFGYEWTKPNLMVGVEPMNECLACTAGAIVAREHNYDGTHTFWVGDMKSEWTRALNALSTLTQSHNSEGLYKAHRYWPNGFPITPSAKFKCPDLNEAGFPAWSESLLDLADRLEAEAS